MEQTMEKRLPSVCDPERSHLDDFRLFYEDPGTVLAWRDVCSKKCAVGRLQCHMSLLVQA